MTGTVTQVAIDNLPGTPGQSLVSGAGGIVVGFVLALIAVRLLLVVSDTERGRSILPVVDPAIAPLLVASVMLMVGRLLEILPIG